MQEKIKVQNASEYDYNLDLNWRDDGDVTNDPSMNDYLKGYQIDPYAFTQWAKTNSKNIKTAAKETIVMHFCPEFLADYILTLWNGVDGNLQDFYDGFTLRYNNNMKKAIAEELKKRGFTVYPTLTDDRAFYAKRLRTVVRLASKANIDTKLQIAKNLFKNSEALNLCLGEIDDIKEMGSKISTARISELLDYYRQIFPEDFAIGLTTNLVQDKVNTSFFDSYKDFNLTDESLKNMERVLSENQDPYDNAVYEGGEKGWDYVTQMRGFDGVRPEQYELPVARASRLRPLKKN